MTRALRALPGVAQVSVVGGIEREMTVELQPAQLEAAGVSVAQVVQALEAQNLAAPVGRLNGGLEERTIRLRGRPEGPHRFRAARGGGAERETRSGWGRWPRCTTARRSPARWRSTTDRQAVGIEIIKSKGYSTTQVSDQIQGAGGATCSAPCRRT